ncbi:MAG: DUF1365 domain-containing protein [Hyphomonadaceae bacterium]|nr:DUF1365 domain-containing protein [Hyphomonadaceae bacterium]
MLPALRLVEGRTVHARFTPFFQRFSYRIFMVDLDVDRFAEAIHSSPFFAIDGPALYSIRTRDHGRRRTGSLRPWAEEKLEHAGVDTKDLSIRLVTFPRHLFYRFAPLSLWLASDTNGVLRGVIYEVNNTFGDTHAYVAPVPESGRMEADKRFHVSPFFDVSGKYRFTLRQSATRLGLVVDSLLDGARQHMASIVAHYEPATSANLARKALSRPLSSLGVTTGIHWEALKLWRRGAGYRSRPAPPQDGQTLAKPIFEHPQEHPR